MNKILRDDQTHALEHLSENATERQRNDLRFWQGVALSLAILVLSVLVSLVLGLGFLLLSR